jgi:hypothetical protein
MAFRGWSVSLLNCNLPLFPLVSDHLQERTASQTLARNLMSVVAGTSPAVVTIAGRDFRMNAWRSSKNFSAAVAPGSTIDRFTVGAPLAGCDALAVALCSQQSPRNTVAGLRSWRYLGVWYDKYGHTFSTGRSMGLLTTLPQSLNTAELSNRLGTRQRRLLQLLLV